MRVPDFTVSYVTNQQELDEALAVRYRVFVEEQHVPIEEEIDHYDVAPWDNPAVVHVLGRYDGIPVAAARLMLDHPEGYPHIGRVAVLAELRGRGYGAAVMAVLHEEARLRGYSGVTLAAQLHAIPFYERLGYVARGEVFLDAGIEHRDMDLVF